MMCIPLSSRVRRVLSQHALNPQQWEDRIKNAWAKLNGIPRCGDNIDHI